MSSCRFPREASGLFDHAHHPRREAQAGQLVDAGPANIICVRSADRSPAPRAAQIVDDHVVILERGRPRRARCDRALPRPVRSRRRDRSLPRALPDQRTFERLADSRPHRPAGLHSPLSGWFARFTSNTRSPSTMTAPHRHNRPLRVGPHIPMTFTTTRLFSLTIELGVETPVPTGRDRALPW